jgi:hypothetical protein
MAGENDLNKLLLSMSPKLMAGEFVFASFRGAHYGDYSHLKPIASIVEKEGLTLVVPSTLADEHGLDYESVFKGISLKMHSSLEAVGLTAAFSSKLAEHGISANVIAGFFHDHIFVKSIDSGRALTALQDFEK